MSLIDTTTLLKIADRAAYQYWKLKATLAYVSLPGSSGLYGDIVTLTDNADLEIPALGPYTDVDNDLEPQRAAQYGTLLGNIISGMEAHFAMPDAVGDPLQMGGWDGYLTSKDVRVSQYFAELYFAVKEAYMLANDVFCERDSRFATARVIGGPAILFTDGVNFGDGDPLNPANGVFFAATQLKVRVASVGGVNLDLRLSVMDKNDNPTTIDVTIPGGTAPGTEIDVGTGSDRFLDVIGVAFVPAGSMGTLGDIVTVRNKKERQIAL